MSTRTESDSLGEVEVPDSALYGAQTQRAVTNFAAMYRPMPGTLVRALALIKSAAAWANLRCDALPHDVAHAIQLAAADIADGKYQDQFPVSVFQTGSGTSTNMNMNEVLASLATQRLGRAVHPNDEVNRSQSSNDVFPSAIQVSACLLLAGRLFPALDSLDTTLGDRSRQLDDVVKTGRTHLMDAMPLTLGQELDTWRASLAECRQRFEDCLPRLTALPLGGSAVGTGVNVPEGFARDAVHRLSTLAESTFSAAAIPSSRMASQHVLEECSSCLRSLAVALTKINNDLRWMASGPLAGLGEISLRPRQPGSSIMPGKVNPVLPEAALMVAAEVIGNDFTIAQAAGSGNFQLNVMLPLIADKLCTGIELLAGACAATRDTIADFEVNRDRLEQVLSRNPMLVTALSTRIGYDAAAAIAKRSYEERRTIIEVAAEHSGIGEQELRRLLDPARLTGSDLDSSS